MFCRCEVRCIRVIERSQTRHEKLRISATGAPRQGRHRRIIAGSQEIHKRPPSSSASVRSTKDGHNTGPNWCHVPRVVGTPYCNTPPTNIHQSSEESNGSSRSKEIANTHIMWYAQKPRLPNNLKMGSQHFTCLKSFRKKQDHVMKHRNVKAKHHYRRWWQTCSRRRVWNRHSAAIPRIRRLYENHLRVQLGPLDLPLVTHSKHQPRQIIPDKRKGI